MLYKHSGELLLFASHEARVFFSQRLITAQLFFILEGKANFFVPGRKGKKGLAC